MKAFPENLRNETLTRGLAAYGIAPTSLTYAPVGFGDHHWNVTADDGRDWFVTVSDLEHKAHCGADAASALTGLRQAMDTALTLRVRDGLGFVVAPVAATDGRSVVPLGERYALTVFPHVAGRTGEFGERLGDADRERVLGLLARLHGSTPPATTAATPLEPAGLSGIHAALDDLTGTWSGGPYAEPARRLLTANATALRARLADFDALARHVRRAGAPRVVTHGEPHPGNLVHGVDGYHLVDWDTVGLALPERDLSLLADDPAALATYTELTGRTPDAAALELYRLRWSLLDVAEFTDWFRAPHEGTEDTQVAWDGFAGTLEQLADRGRTEVIDSN
ncbi:phosphotransferase [Streptomyces flavofungini]|uniref:phosphotransferase n=1 Tax=Streptomyces flavofungini TaxID=68200 RepID=UPI0025B03378|nr:phosphotransferase [Streptomyces flavofungini]WJV44249.1 phosphotransferase [Streptomyces flavofungini]